MKAGVLRWTEPSDILFRKDRTVPVWLDELADHFERLVKAPNNGEWPTTRGQVRKLAAAVEFNRVLDFRTEAPLPGFELDDVICVVDTGDDFEVLPRAVHELVEAVAQSPVVPELRIPEEYFAVYGRLLGHEIARIVEQRHREYLVFVMHARAYAAKKRGKRNARPCPFTSELVYERDETCDKDFKEDWD